MRRSLALLLGTALTACGTDDEAPPSAAPPCPTLGDACEPAPGAPPALGPATRVVPSSSMPPEVVSQVSHNNLDVVWHEGRLFFAFRTGPFHFASPEVVLYVVSTTDQRSWRFEGKIAMERDLREPRFLSLQGRLFLFFALLGTNPLAFEPEGAARVEWLGPGRLTEPERVFEDGFLPWRTRVIDGRGYVVGYVGGENIYQGLEETVQVHWLATDDGVSFRPVVPGQPVVLEGGVSETDFAFLEDGSVIAVGRNELGDESGWGSSVCTAPAGDLGAWTCRNDPRKFDSLILWRHGADVWMIARRQLANDGKYDLGRRELTPREQTAAYEAEYWRTPKRCALWKVLPATRAVEHVLDLPSAGDTCFPGVVPLGGPNYLVYDYSSPLDAPDTTWVAGQQGPTHIHRMTLTLP